MSRANIVEIGTKIVDFDEIEVRLATAGSWFQGIEIFTWTMMTLALLGILFNLWFRKKRKLRENAANIMIAAGNYVLNLTTYGATFVIALGLIEPFALFEIPVNNFTWALAILAADFSYYWMHRIEHKVRLLWVVHNVHHSSEEYDLTTSLRLSWFESGFEWVFLVPMILLGFDLVQTLIGFFLVLGYQTWIHTEMVGRLGWIDKIFNTPSVHRVHHGKNPQYIDKNYAGILVIWDRLFGSYEPEVEPVAYGLTNPVNTANPFALHFRELISLCWDCYSARNIGQFLSYIVRAPGWQPPALVIDNGSDSGKPAELNR